MELEMSPEFLLFIARKLSVCAILFAGFVLLDRGPLRSFHTAEVLKDDPKAVAILLGSWALAIALS
jgi:hypothetical protein